MKVTSEAGTTLSNFPAIAVMRRSDSLTEMAEEELMLSIKDRTETMRLTVIFVRYLTFFFYLMLRNKELQCY